MNWLQKCDRDAKRLPAEKRQQFIDCMYKKHMKLGEARDIGMSPLFIPLKREYFEAFERGEKVEEFRPYGPRWNERTCPKGRQVVLSLGYGKQRRLSGHVAGFRTDEQPQLMPAWVNCYGDKHAVAACIKIELERTP